MGRPTPDDRLDAGQPRGAAQERERDPTVTELDESRLVPLGRAIGGPGRALVHVPAGSPDGPLVPLGRGDRGDPEVRDAASGCGALSRRPRSPPVERGADDVHGHLQLGEAHEPTVDEVREAGRRARDDDADDRADDAVADRL